MFTEGTADNLLCTLKIYNRHRERHSVLFFSFKHSTTSNNTYQGSTNYISCFNTVSEMFSRPTRISVTRGQS